MEMTEVSKAKPLFFASDSEEEGVQATMDVVPLDETSIAVAEASKKRLFFASSDDESDSRPANIDDIVKRRTQNALSSPSVVASSSPHFASYSVSSVCSTSPPQPKKRKVTPPEMKKQQDPRQTAMSLNPVLESTGFEPPYIGSFLVPNAWSTCKGRGWVKAGEEICIRRNEGDAASVSSIKSNSSKPKTDKKVSGKQLKLTSMMKVKDNGPVPKPIKRHKPDNVVRFTNSRGFGEWSSLGCFHVYEKSRDRKAPPKRGVVGFQTS